MNRIVHAVQTAAVFVAALAGAASARAELASDFLDPNDNGTFLLYGEGDRVYRMRCDGTSSTYNHAHCKDKPASAPATAFFATLPTKFATALPRFEREAQEAYVKIQQIDVRLFELVNTQVPQGSDPVTDAQIKVATRAVEDAVVACTALRDQIGRLEAALRQDQGDQADIEQLALDRARLIELERAQNTAEAELLTLRQTYVQERAAASDANFRDLVAMRKTQLNAYNNAKDAAEREVRDLGCAALMASRIQETGFAWETVCQLATSESGGGNARQRIGAAFAEVELADRTFTGEVIGNRHVEVVVPRSGLVSGVQCHYPLAGNNGFLGDLGVDGPNDLTLDSALDVHGDEVNVGWGEGFIGHEDNVLSDAQLQYRDGQGRWKFDFIPHFIGGAGGSATKPLRCSVTLRRPS